jgi:(1->4)-alpha-D-glucan 1-alpha-D-glucosylmutase
VVWVELRAVLSALLHFAPPAPVQEKLALLVAALDLRARRPVSFAGAYTPIPAGEDVCAFLRGDDVLVAVALRETATGEGGWRLPAAAAGRWRDVLDGAEHDLPAGASAASVLGPEGRALLERR